MTAMQPRSREEAKMLGLPDWQIDQMFPAMDIEAQHNFDAPPQQPQGGLLANPEKPAGFWQGGEKFGWRDGIGGLLSVFGDALARNGGGEGFAVQGLLDSRNRATEMARKKAEEQAQLAQMMAVGQANGLTPEQVQAQALGLKLPEQEKPHELQRLAALANDPTQPPEVREAARMKLRDDPVLTGVNLPNGGQYYGRLSGLQNYTGQKQGGDTPMTPEEIRAMGLPEGGPGGNRPGGFRR